MLILILFLLTAYLFLSIFYEIVIVILSHFKQMNYVNLAPKNKFIFLVPAHNEERVIGFLLDSIKNVDYPKDLYRICVIADNCTDKTESIVKSKGVLCYSRKDTTRQGKGYAISWGLSRISLDFFDAIIIVDADSYLDKNFLNAMNSAMEKGVKVAQGYNGTLNIEDSWLTNITHISSTLRNNYYFARSKFGLSVPLEGNGMCISKDILNQCEWKAFTTGEDTEYYTELLLRGIKVSYVPQAKVFSQAAKSLKQAVSQRLRWSKNKRTQIVKYGFKVLRKGISSLNIEQIESALDLLRPNYSLQLNLTILSLLAALTMQNCYIKKLFLLCLGILVCIQFLYYLYGIKLSGCFLRIIKISFLILIFLIWKLILDILAYIGISKVKWKRTERI